jgi:hypothetical protein
VNFTVWLLQVSGEAKPRKTILADGSESYRRAGAACDEAPTVLAPPSG